jgi:hypothetical protein
MVLNRLRQIIALSRTAPATGGQSASAVYRGAGVVVPSRNAGQMVRRTGARTMPASTLGTRSFKQASAPTFPAYGDRFGPNSWVYGMRPGAGVVLVSAHNRRTR